MQRYMLVALLAILLTLPVLACEPTPTPTPTVAPPTETAMPGPIAPTATPTALSAATPTPIHTPVPNSIDLGVPAGDAYSPQALAVDGARGLVYVVSGYGDAAESENQSVLSVIDVAHGTVRETVSLPYPFRGSTSTALSPDGGRLFIAGGGDHVLLVVATGTGGSPLGEVLFTEFDVRAAALDPISMRLYTSGASRIRMLDANTLGELQSVEMPATVPGLPSSVLLAVNPEVSRLYVGSPSSELVTVFSTDDMELVTDFPGGGQLESLTTSRNDPRSYFVLRAEPAGITQVSVIDDDQVTQVWQPEDGFRIRGVVSDDEPERVFLWETNDNGDTRLRGVEPSSGQTAMTTPLPTGSITAAAVSAGWLHFVTWNNQLVVIAIDTGAVELLERLGVRLQNVIADHDTERLFVTDSAGDIHVLDAISLQKIDTWPQVLGSRVEAIYAVPVSVVDERLYVPDYNAEETVALDAVSGSTVATIPRAGQVTFDPVRNRLFVTGQGVFIVDPETYEVVDSIEDTLRKTLYSGEPSAIAAHYYAEYDLLFVEMTNNTPGSSSRTWLRVYDGDTLQQLETDIQTDQQFLSGLVVDQSMDRVYVASEFPGGDVAIFAVGGDLVARLESLAGELFLNRPANRLYVTGWGGLVTLDTRSNSVINYGRLPADYSDFTIVDIVTDRVYRTRSNSADLLIEPLSTQEPAIPQAIDQLPPDRIRDLAISDDGTVFAVNDSGGVYRQTDSGWQRVDGMLPPIGSPAVYPVPGAPNMLFAYLEKRERMGESYGPFRSVDGGRTWQPAMRGLQDFAIRDMAISPDFAADQTAFLLAGEDGLFRTTDGGDTWERVSDIAGYAVALAATPDTPTLLMLAQKPDVYNETQIYASTDAGDTIAQVAPVAAELSGGRGFALSPNFAEDGIVVSASFLSQDFGRTWRRLPLQSEAFASRYTILFSPNFGSDGTVYVLIAPSYFGREDRGVLYRSTDGGQTWQRAVNADPLMSALAMGPNGRLWVGTATGEVRPLDLGRLTWEIAREPTPTPIPTPDEPPAGFYRPEGTFANLWSTDREVRLALGWAAGATSQQASTALQPFELGPDL